MVSAAKLHRHSERRRAGRFLAEGPNLVGAAAQSGLVDDVFATPGAAARHPDLLAGLRVRLVTDAAAKVLSDTVTPSGLIAVCRTPRIELADVLADVLADGPGLLAVAVDLSEPGNAGTLIRIAHAMGADAVVFAGHCVDPYNGKCLRSSAGSIFALPVLTDPDAVGVLTALGAASFRILATTTNGELSLDDAESELTGPTAWMFGPESHGLPADVAALADHRVTIPMPGGTESLNVAAAAAICLYQSARVRRAGAAD